MNPQPTRQQGKDVTSSFGANPLGYSGQNVLNAYNMSQGGALQGVVLPIAQNPFVNASDSVVTLNAHQHQGNTNLSVSPAGGQGIPAHSMRTTSPRARASSRASRECRCIRVRAGRPRW
ncbi:hypothetical protein [Myxococcus xanthus]|uniref:hypothetical protein n=1 Tax=Myxococcus xanthus TaxID=34 RepID=UPI0020A401BE|nr:hypothetical protein [Myxococcus xanthus]